MTEAIVWLTATLNCTCAAAGAPIVSTAAGYPSLSWLIWYCSSFL